MGWSQPSINLLQQLSRGCGGKEPWVCITSSTLHCRGKNVRSKKIGQTNQKMIHFVPKMYVSGKISALRPGTQTVMIFGATKKSENYLKQRDFRICGFLRFLVFFCFFAGFFAGLRALSLVVWCAANIFWPLSHQTKKHAISCNQSPKIEDQSSI